MDVATVAVLLLVRLALAGFVLVVLDFAGFSNNLALDFDLGAFCTLRAAFFAASLADFAAFFSAFLALFAACLTFFAAFLSAFLACLSARLAFFAALFSAFLACFSARLASCAAFFSAFLAFFSAISFAFVFFAISIPIESLENDTHNRFADELVAAFTSKRYYADLAVQ